MAIMIIDTMTNKERGPYPAHVGDYCGNINIYSKYPLKNYRNSLIIPIIILS